MTIDPRITAYRDTPNKSYRQNVPRKGVCLHHGALTSFDYLRRLAMGEKQVSATNIIKDLNNEQLMTDEFRAWSLSSAWGDSSFRTVETCNESTDGWTISDASHWTLARMVAYWAQKDGFWPSRSGDPRTWTVLGHREVYTIWGESYGTACPGGMDLDLVTRRAQQLLTTASTAAETTEPIEEEDNMPKNSAVGWKRRDGVWQFMIFNTESGFEVNHTDTGAAYNNPLAAAFDTPSWATVSEAHAGLIKAGLEIVRQSKASGSLTLTVPEAVRIDDIDQ